MIGITRARDGGLIDEYVARVLEFAADGIARLPENQIVIATATLAAEFSIIAESISDCPEGVGGIIEILRLSLGGALSATA